MKLHKQMNALIKTARYYFYMIQGKTQQIQNDNDP